MSNKIYVIAFFIGAITGLLVFSAFALLSIKKSQIMIHEKLSKIELYISEFERYETQE
jgi:hypothetical protein